MKTLAGWLLFWWVPIVGIRWEDGRWLQHHREEIPEFVLVGGAMLWAVIALAAIIGIVATWVGA